MRWEQALAASASRMRDPELEAILLRLDLHKPRRWKAIRSQLPAELLPRIESLRPRKQVRCVTFDHTQIMESAEGWSCCKTGEMISDIVIRVTHVVRIRPKAKQGGFLIHSGYAIYRRRRFRWHIQCSRGGSLIDRIERRIAGPRSWHPADLAMLAQAAAQAWPWRSAHRVCSSDARTATAGKNNCQPVECQGVQVACRCPPTPVRDEAAADRPFGLAGIEPGLLKKPILLAPMHSRQRHWLRHGRGCWPLRRGMAQPLC